MRTFEDNVVPNLLRHIFPSYRVPRINFGEGGLPHRVPGEAWCVDSTLASGLPVVGTLSTEQIIELFELIDAVDNKSGLIRQAELLVGGMPERDAINLLYQRYKQGELHVEPVAVIVPHPENVAAIMGLGLREVGIKFAVSDYHLLPEGSTTRREPVQQLLDAMDACLEEGAAIRLDLLDVTRADLDGFVLPLIEDCVEYLGSKGSLPPRIRLCDSLGLGVPWTESPVPRSVPRMIHTLCHALKLESSEMEFLGHNDLGLALANTVAAMMHGSSGLVCAFGGLGERCGVAATEQMLIHLAGHYGVDPSFAAIQKVFDFLREQGVEISSNLPLWGTRALTESFAPHGNAFSVTHDMGAPFDTAKILDLEGDMEIWRRGGAPALIHLIRAWIPDAELGCEDKAVVSILAWLEEQELELVSWADIEEKVQELLPEYFESEDEVEGAEE